MVILGADLHKWSHTVVAIDEHGRKVGERTVSANREGHLELRRWAAQWPARRWALEDGRHLSRRLEADLLRAGEDVVRVPPKLMAGVRRSVRQPGKSDPIDALAVARAALREPDLPTARLDGVEREVRALVAERTREIQRLRWFLVELEIAEPAPAALDRAVVQARLADELAPRTGLVARFAREILGRIVELSATIRGLEREIEGRIRGLAPALLDLVGCGPLTAAKIVGETAGVDRFRSKEAFARHNGTAPVPVWSGNSVRHRLSRGVTVNSTSRSTGSPSPRCDSVAPAAPTWTTAGPPATRRRRRFGPSDDASATRSSGASDSMKTHVCTPRPS
jgi:transposase